MSPKAMKLRHTSDWHIGRTLYRREQYEEFYVFLNQPERLIETDDFDIVCGKEELCPERLT